MRVAPLLVSLICNAAVASPGIRELRAEERAAVKAKDNAALLKVERALVEAAPVARHLYGLACAEALNGNKNAALDALENAAALDIPLPAAKDPDLASLKGDPRFEAVLARFAKSATPSGAIPAAFELSPFDLLVEDLVRDQGAFPIQLWFFTSVRRRAVFSLASVTPGLRLEDWPGGIPQPGFNQFAKTPYAALGIDFDAKRNVLWVSTAALEEEDGHRKEDEGKTAVLELDAKTGKLLHRYDAPVKGALGDLRLGPDGTVYVSDGLSGIVYSLKSGGALEKLSGDFMSPQTQAVRGGELIVADYSLGIAAIDLTSKKQRWISRQTGVDGIALYGDDLYAVQNGVNPPRIFRLRGDTVETLQRGGDLADPTHAIVADGALWVIARSGWEKSGKPPIIKRLPLSKAITP